MRTRLAFLIMLAMLAWSSFARAAVPNQFSVQGVLRDGAGTLQSMPVDISVSLFDASTSGTKLAGPFATSSVAVTDGLFTVPITDANLPTELGSAAQVWIEVTIGTDVFPRQQLTSQLFALMCGTADTAKSYAGATLGVGTSTPARALHVVTNASGGDDRLVAKFENTGDNTAVSMVTGIEITDGVVSTGLWALGQNYGGQAGYSSLQGSKAGVQLYALDPAGIVRFLTGGENERMRITSSGEVGIGTAAPSAALHVAGTGYLGGRVVSQSTDHGAAMSVVGFPLTGLQDIALLELSDGTPSDTAFIGLTGSGSGPVGDLRFITGGTNDRMRITKGGLVGINTSAPSHQLHVNGDARNTTGVWATSSDQRLKRDIQAIEGALETVLGLRGVSFHWKDEAKDKKLGRVQGFIAQEVERVKPEWVKQGADGMKMIETIGMDALLVESIKAQQGQIKTLRDENETLKARLAKIEARLDAASPHDKRASR